MHRKLGVKRRSGGEGVMSRVAGDAASTIAAQVYEEGRDGRFTGSIRDEVLARQLAAGVL